MCGIVGVFPVSSKKNIEQASREAAIRYLATEMLVHAENRGQDASGIGTLFADGNWMVLKQNVPTSEFVLNIGQVKYANQPAEDNFMQVMRRWRLMSERKAPTASCIGHSRKGTKGAASKPENNHPFVFGNIIGVHNGKLNNDDRIFSKNPGLKREGEVDSEAIFQLAHLMGNDIPPSLGFMCELERKLDGEYAVLLVNRMFPQVVGGMRKERPMEVCFSRDLDLLLVASEKEHIDKAVTSYNRMIISTGSSFPLAKDFDTKYIVERTVVSFDLSREGTAVKDFLSERDIPFGSAGRDGEYVEAEKVKTYPSSSAWSGHQGNYQKDLTTKAKVEYIEFDTEAKPVALLPEKTSREEVVEVSTVSTEDFINPTYVSEGEEILLKLLENNHPINLWPKDLDIHKAIKDCGLTVMDSVTLWGDEDIVEAAKGGYHEGFCEGFAIGFEGASIQASSTELDVSVQEKRIKEIKASHLRDKKKWGSFVSNLRTILVSCLISGNWIKESDEGDLELDERLVEHAQSLDDGFDPDRVLKLFKSKEVKETLASLIRNSQVGEEDEGTSDTDTDSTFEMYGRGLEE